MLIHNRDGIKFVTEFPCLLKHTKDALLEHTLHGDEHIENALLRAQI